MAGPAGKKGIKPVAAVKPPKVVATPRVNAATGRTMTKPVTPPKMTAATAKTAGTTQARLAYTGAAGRSPQVNKATGFTTSTVKVAATPRATGFTAVRPPDNGPLSGVAQFIQSHVDQATGKSPTAISAAVKGGADRSYGALRPRK